LFLELFQRSQNIIEFTRSIDPLIGFLRCLLFSEPVMEWITVSRCKRRSSSGRSTTHCFVKENDVKIHGSLQLQFRDVIGYLATFIQILLSLYLKSFILIIMPLMFIGLRLFTADSFEGILVYFLFVKSFY
jgi:hypothetical protein